MQNIAVLDEQSGGIDNGTVILVWLMKTVMATISC
jgi:hypothetical protein